MAKKKKVEASLIQLTRLVDDVLIIPIKGVTPVIPHKWSKKARGMMPGHPDKPEIAEVKGKRKPEEEAAACLYYLEKNGDRERLGILATAFKAAMVGACRFFDKLAMVEAKQILYIEGKGPEQLVEITFGEKVLREDTPRNAGGGADLRYRYALHDWSAEITVRFPPSIITAESVVALLDAGGRGGVGDWRPSAPKSYTGTYGTWRVDDEKLAEVSHG